MNYTLGHRMVEEDSYVVAVGGELDMGAAPALRATIDRILEDGARTLVVDLSEVTFIDSTSIGVLMSALHRLKATGGSIELVCTEPNVLRVFEVVGLDRQLPIHA